MSVQRYWSVEECCWVDCPVQPPAVEAAVPQQRTDEPAQEPVDA
jgi:hypothetical protein